MRRHTVLEVMGVLTVFPCIIFAASAEIPPTDDLRIKFIGDAQCEKCHVTEGVSYEKTPHRLTLQLPDPTTILGSFTAPKNILQTLDPKTSLLGDGLTFQVVHSESQFFQIATHTEIDDARGTTRKSIQKARIDLVTGAGVRGQSYLYWKGAQLFELPVSYWADGHQWINSPNYPDGTEIFDRPIYPRCLECHTTFIQSTSSGPQSNTYVVSSLIAGITCEKCHGPGRRHAELEESSKQHLLPADVAILNPRRFSRERQIELCALCHNGANRVATRPAFSFHAGAAIDDFFAPDVNETDTQPDVHGNQVALLRRSQCFKASGSMTCSTCHDEHAPERPADEYSSRCLKCHQMSSCGLFKSMGESIESGCIQCHMPIQPTKAIVSRTGGRHIQAKMRTHWIKVYH